MKFLAKRETSSKAMLCVGFTLVHQMLGALCCEPGIWEKRFCVRTAFRGFLAWRNKRQFNSILDEA